MITVVNMPTQPSFAQARNFIEFWYWSLALAGCAIVAWEKVPEYRDSQERAEFNPSS